MNKENVKVRLKDFFAQAENKQVNMVYVTADENIFKAEHYAVNWATGLKDKTVRPVSRAEVESKEPKAVAEAESGEPKAESK